MFSFNHLFAPPSPQKQLPQWLTAWQNLQNDRLITQSKLKISFDICPVCTQKLVKTEAPFLWICFFARCKPHYADFVM